MNKNEIDALLKSVSPELIAGYEARNLGGKTLKEVEQEWESNNRKIKKMNRKIFLVLILSAIFSWAFLAGFLYVDINIIGIRYAGTTFLVSFSPFIFAIFWTFGPRMEVLREFQCTQKQLEKILEDFKQLVHGLNPLRADVVRYDEDSVRYILVSLAGEKEDKDGRFNEGCRHRASPEEVMALASSVIDCERRLDVTLETAVEKFGLTFNKEELFRSAKAKRTWEDEGCPM